MLRRDLEQTHLRPLYEALSAQTSLLEVHLQEQREGMREQLVVMREEMAKMVKQEV